MSFPFLFYYVPLISSFPTGHSTYLKEPSWPQHDCAIGCPFLFFSIHCLLGSSQSGGCACACIPLDARMGYTRASRLTCLLVSDRLLIFVGAPVFHVCPLSWSDWLLIPRRSALFAHAYLWSSGRFPRPCMTSMTAPSGVLSFSFLLRASHFLISHGPLHLLKGAELAAA